MSYSVLELSSVIANYTSYRDMGAVDDVQMINPKEGWDSVVSSLQNEKIGAENEAMLKNLLRQPIMADIYADNGISPRDVPAYIDSVLKGSENSKRLLLSSLAGAYDNAAESMRREESPVVNGMRELYSLKAHILVARADGRPSAVVSSMEKFNTSRQPAEPEKKKRMVKLKEGVRWCEKALRKFAVGAGIFAVIGSGEVVVPQLNENALNKVLAKDNTKANDANTLQLVAKNTQHQA